MWEERDESNGKANTQDSCQEFHTLAVIEPCLPQSFLAVRARGETLHVAQSSVP